MRRIQAVELLGAGAVTASTLTLVASSTHAQRLMVMEYFQSMKAITIPEGMDHGGDQGANPE